MSVSIIKFFLKYWSLFSVPLAFVVYVRPARLRVRAQAWWLMFLLLCASKGIVNEYLGGDAMVPELPEQLIWLMNWLEGGLFFLVGLSFVWWKRRGRTWLLPSIAWGISAWGVISGIVPPSVREVELEYPNLPPSLDGYRLVQVSDIHCSSAARRWRTQAIVDRVNALDADLVCLTGDYVDGQVAERGGDLLPICSFKARDGVYAVLGNHEYYRDRVEWTAWYKANGLKFLSSECVFPREGLALGGVSDCSEAWGCHNAIHTFASATNGEFRVMMVHRPTRARDNVGSGNVDLQLSGHTHGGIGPLVDRFVASYNDGFVRGLYRIGSGALYVSPGSGQWAGFPMRFFNASEVTLFTLRRPRPGVPNAN